MLLPGARLRSRRARLPEEWWRGDHGAFLAFTESGEPACLIPGRFGYRHIDPEGRERKVGRQFTETLAPEAYIFYRPLPDGKVTSRMLLGFVFRNNVRAFATILIASACAALLALPFRANIPVAAAMTFLSNPATTPLILMASVWLGNWMLGRSADASGFMALVDGHAGIGQWTAWLLSEAAPAMLLGLALISCVCAAIGYVVADWFWRHRMGRKWRARKLRIGKVHQSRPLEKAAGA